MKKILFFVLSLFLVCSCYEDYVKDYEYDGIYVAYQYDLRSFIIGENTELQFGVSLGGVMENDRDRNVYYVIDDNLLTKDLSVYGGDESFYAVDGMKGLGKCGLLTSTYVTDAFNSAGVNAIKPFPSEYFSLSDNNKIVVKKDFHTGVISFTADNEKLLADKHFGHDPYYGIGFRIVEADADTVLLDRSFEVIALRAENIFFGDWYHGGKSHVEMNGQVVDGSENVYATQKPCDDNSLYKYTLSTATPLSVTTSFFHNQAGSMTITMDGINADNITVSDADGRITDMGSSWNKAKLLQGRQLYLNYKYANEDGSVTVVTDTLSFRNRTNDGINEWQDTDPEHYK